MMENYPPFTEKSRIKSDSMAVKMRWMDGSSNDERGMPEVLLKGYNKIRP